MQNILARARVNADRVKLREKENLEQWITLARPGAVNDLGDGLQGNLHQRRHTIMRNYSIAKTGPAWQDVNDPAQRVGIFIENTVTDPGEIASNHYFFGDRLRIYVPNNLADADYTKLLNNLIVLVHYQDARKPKEIMARDCLRVDNRRPNCGNNTTTPVEGTRTEIIDLGNFYRFEGAEVIALHPKDKVKTIGFAWLGGTAPAAPSVTSLNLCICVDGDLFAPLGRK